tara:strand:- start:632 stop:1141 length:510 start_codon:yes stop_codon:yes gene_type:complete
VVILDTGKNFESEVRKSLKVSNCFWFRIQDTNDVSRFVKQAISEKQPGDFFAVYKGTPFLLECKTSQRQTSFPIFYGKTKSIPDHQVEGAKEVEKHGGKAFFLIRRDEKRNKRTWALTWKQVYQMYKTKSKSVSWDWIIKKGIEVQRLSSPVRWDMEELFNKTLNRTKG